jgi:hypothetical protein
MAKRRKPEPVGIDEVVDAVLRMFVEKFDGRHLDWETIERALAIVNFKVKEAALFAQPVKP